MNSNQQKYGDPLWLHLFELPYFRALMRAVEASFYPQFELPEPTLDVGCGDGHFATVAFDHRITMGLDPAEGSLQEARRRGGYSFLCLADGGRMPYKDSAFASAFSNSVLEHIPHVDVVLEEIGRVVQSGGTFAFCGPNQRFLDALAISNALDGLHLVRLAGAYRSFFNRISRHYHSDSPEVWQGRLLAAGFRLKEWWYYYPPDALRVTEWGHYFGLPSLIWRKLTGRWILLPTRWNLSLTERFTRKHFLPTACEDGVCTFFLAVRV